MTIIDIIKTHVCGEFFSEYPTDLESHPFDFFMKADIDVDLPVNHSSMIEWGYEICEVYEIDDIGAIRGAMRSMFDGLYELKNTLFNHAVKSVQINLDDFVDCNTFYDFVQSGNGILHRQGTADEYATLLTVSAEAVL